VFINYSRRLASSSATNSLPTAYIFLIKKLNSIKRHDEGISTIKMSAIKKQDIL
jgi:hypothetical protein